jgi:hypothetical protein
MLINCAVYLRVTLPQMSEIYISEEQFNKFHHWIRIASAKEHSEFHRELTKLGLQEQFWLKQIIGHSKVI